MSKPAVASLLSIQERERLHRTRLAAITELRREFERQGINVDMFTDDQVSGSLLDAAAPDLSSTRDLFARAFTRLQGLQGSGVEAVSSSIRTPARPSLRR